MRPVFIASVGNPGSEYAHTLHSAGHTLLAALVEYLALPPLRQSQVLTGTKGRASYSDEQGITLWESPTYMNESGPNVITAFKKWSTSSAIRNFDQNAPPRLIVLHDELELPVGKFSVKTGIGQSARGHNGLKSILGSGMSATKFTRVGVGIGPRPESREPSDVARFVLYKMTRTQRMTIESLSERIWAEIEKIREGQA